MISDEGRPINAGMDQQLPNVGEQREVDIRVKHLKEREGRAKMDLFKVLNTAEGRRVFWSLLGMCRMFHGLSYDPVLANREEGGRNIGLQLINLINMVDPRLYPQMQLEAIQEAERDAAILAIVTSSTPEHPDL